GFDPSAAWLDAVMQDPVLSGTKLIAESWDLGHDGYQVGNFPPGWAEWNGRYRDDIRSYWRGESGHLPKLARNLLGSADMFDHAGRKPWASVNFITAHDGFTLADLVSYNEKHNEANGEGGRDGHDDNRSWNYGVEGPTDDTDILDLRDRMRRNHMTTLMLSQGTPMMLMGDEIGRTQFGNNNAYCQDTEMNWLAWETPDPRNASFKAFVTGLIALRREMPVFSQTRFLHGDLLEPAPADDARDILWLRPDGARMEEADWHSANPKTLAMVLAAQSGSRAIVFFNAFEADMTFTLPETLAALDWRLVVSTAAGEVHPFAGAPAAHAPFLVPARSVLAVASQLN
ncbi:MAG: glycogen debranching enzyme GlgX, partial [Pseudomonadota bacterium]